MKIPETQWFNVQPNSIEGGFQAGSVSDPNAESRQNMQAAVNYAFAWNKRNKQSTVDDDIAKVQEWENNSLRHPETGLFSKHGKNAVFVNGNDGETWHEKLPKDREDFIKKLTENYDDEQRAMFQKRVKPLTTSYMGTLGVNTIQQGDAWHRQAYSANVENAYRSAAGATGDQDLQAAFKRGEEALREQASLDGWDDAYLNEQIFGRRAAVWDVRFTDCYDRGDSKGAAKILKDHWNEFSPEKRNHYQDVLNDKQEALEWYTRGQNAGYTGGSLPEGRTLNLSGKGGKGTLNVRNNNPGNLRNRDGSFKRFATPEAGTYAMAEQLVAYYNKGANTVNQIISTWSPVSDKGNKPGSTAAYVANVAKTIGVEPNAKINLKDPALLSKLMRAIMAQEGGSVPYSQSVFDNAAERGVKTKRVTGVQIQAPIGGVSGGKAMNIAGGSVSLGDNPDAYRAQFSSMAWKMGFERNNPFLQQAAMQGFNYGYAGYMAAQQQQQLAEMKVDRENAATYYQMVDDMLTNDKEYAGVSPIFRKSRMKLEGMLKLYGANKETIDSVMQYYDNGGQSGVKTDNKLFNQLATHPEELAKTNLGAYKNKLSADDYNMLLSRQKKHIESGRIETVDKATTESKLSEAASKNGVTWSKLDNAQKNRAYNLYRDEYARVLKAKGSVSAEDSMNIGRMAFGEVVTNQGWAIFGSSKTRRFDMDAEQQFNHVQENSNGNWGHVWSDVLGLPSESVIKNGPKTADEKKQVALYELLRKRAEGRKDNVNNYDIAQEYYNLIEEKRQTEIYR